MNQSAASILLTCLKNISPASKAEALGNISAEEWRGVVELAQQHSVQSLLYFNLKSLNLALPNEMAEELKREYKHNALWNMRMYKELNKLLRLLKEDGIPVIVLKGAYLAEAVYTDIGLRTMVDVDLLVKKEDALRLEQKLPALGCVPVDFNRVIAEDNHHFAYRLPGSGLSVEIHWTLADTNYPFRVDMEGLWNRSQVVKLAQFSTLTLSLEDLLIHLCLHTATHAYQMSLRMFCDIQELIRSRGAEMNWQEVASRARQWGVVHAVHLVLCLVRELLNIDILEAWLASICPKDFSKQYLDLAREQILFSRNGEQATVSEPGYLPFPQLAQLWGPKDLKSKLALIRSRLFPSHESMARQYPVAANSWRVYWYYPVRLRDILVGRGAAMWKMARGDREMKVIAERTNQVVALRDWLISG